jgi:predicted dehydrogenase
MARVRFPSDAMSVSLADGPRTPDTTLVSVAHDVMSGALVDQFAYFLRRVTNNLPLERVTGDDALRSLAVTLAIMRSAATQQEVRLDRE